MHEWCLEVWGDYACFTRPEMKVERVSYDVITPSAARAIYDSILWKPAIKWQINKIEVLNPLKWVSVRRNEVSKVIGKPTKGHLAGLMSEPLGIFIEEERQQRAGLFLQDVCYSIYANFEFIPPEKRKKNNSSQGEFWSDNSEKENFERADETPAKYAAMFERRAKKGQCFHRPYLGCREFSCYFKLLNSNISHEKQPIKDTRDLGFMLYDLDFTNLENPMPRFFRAFMNNGVVHIPHPTSEEIKG